MRLPLLLKKTTITLKIVDPPDEPKVADKPKPKPKPKEDRVSKDYDGTYSVGGTYNRVATRMKWQQIDADTARLTVYADGQEPTVGEVLQHIEEHPGEPLPNQQPPDLSQLA